MAGRSTAKPARGRACGESGGRGRGDLLREYRGKRDFRPEHWLLVQTADKAAG